MYLFISNFLFYLIIKVVSELLKEMNNDVEGYFLLDNYKRILKEGSIYI